MQLALSERDPLPLDVIREDPVLKAAILRAMPHGDYIGMLREDTAFPPPTAAGFDSWSHRCQFLAQEIYRLGFRYEPEHNQPRLLAPPKDGMQLTLVVVTGEMKGQHVLMGDKGVVTRRFIRDNHSWDPLGQTQIPLEELEGAEPELLRALTVMLVCRRTKQNLLRIYAVVPTRIIRSGEFYCCDSELLGIIDMNTYVAPVQDMEQPDSKPSMFTLPEKPQEPVELSEPGQDDQTGTDG